ncbi:hypothetical protein M0802_014383 [Mischocyttarus mexicanus]|nr:hypothetical protein M0802_014383 [Mischocyttarus mexicanus]
MGSAYRLLIGVEFHAIEEFLEAVKKTFSPRKTANQYIGEIGNLRQNPNETVMQYACRIRELETALIDSIKSEFPENSAQIINKVEIGVLERREPVKGVYFEEVVVRPEKGKATIDVVNDTDDPIIMKIPTLPIIPLKERVNPVAGDLEGGEVTSGVNSRTEKPTMGDNLSEDEEIGMLEILKDVNSYGKGKKINESIYESCGDKVDEEKLSRESLKGLFDYEERIDREPYNEEIDAIINGGINDEITYTDFCNVITELAANGSSDSAKELDVQVDLRNSNLQYIKNNEIINEIRNLIFYNQPDSLPTTRKDRLLSLLRLEDLGVGEKRQVEYIAEK